MDGTTHHPISREELSARLAGDRVFSGVRFAADIALDELELLPPLLGDPPGRRCTGEADGPQLGEEGVHRRGVGRCRPPHSDAPAEHRARVGEAATERRRLDRQPRSAVR